MDLTERTTKRTVIHKGKVTEYSLEEVLLPNGKKTVREIVHHGAGVAVIPFLENGSVLFVKQYRKAIRGNSIEIPAGFIDIEDTDALEAAKREMIEETGYQAKEWNYITSFYSSPGFTDAHVSIYEAKKLLKTKESLSLDESEFLEVLELTFEQAWERYERKEISDGKTVFALFYWKQIRKEIKGE